MVDFDATELRLGGNRRLIIEVLFHLLGANFAWAGTPEGNIEEVVFLEGFPFACFLNRSDGVRSETFPWRSLIEIEYVAAKCG